MNNERMNRSPLQLGRVIGIGAVLLASAPVIAQGERWYAEEQVERGAAVFAQNCAECHGANAEATPNWQETTPDGKYPPPPLNGTAHASHQDAGSDPCSQDCGCALACGGCAATLAAVVVERFHPHPTEALLPAPSFSDGLTSRPISPAERPPRFLLD